MIEIEKISNDVFHFKYTNEKYRICCRLKLENFQDIDDRKVFSLNTFMDTNTFRFSSNESIFMVEGGALVPYYHGCDSYNNLPEEVQVAVKKLLKLYYGPLS